MFKKFYLTLTIDSIRKNRKFYYPYIMTCMIMVTITYLLLNLISLPILKQLDYSPLVGLVFGFGAVVMAAFSCLFLFYTHSYLIRIRKKEFGLYHILGMTKRNIAKLNLLETCFIYLFSCISGILIAILLSKELEAIIAYMLELKLDYTLHIQLPQIGTIFGIFAFIFGIIHINSVKTIYLSNPIELLKSENMGEKPPKSNYLLGIIGLILLIIGYILALIVQDPTESIFMFMIASIIVIVATYCLMIFGSIVLINLLKKNKNYYYKPTHFISISSLGYRLKRNGAGLASICVLITMILVTLSTTITLYTSQKRMLEASYPRDIALDVTSTNLTSINKIKQTLNNNQINYSKLINYSHIYYKNVAYVNNQFVQTNKESNSNYRLVIFDVDTYNQIENKNIKLNNQEVYYFSNIFKANKQINLNGKVYKINKQLSNDDRLIVSNYSSMVGKVIVLVINEKPFTYQANYVQHLHFNTTSNDKKILKLNHIKGYNLAIKKEVESMLKSFTAPLIVIGYLLSFVFLVSALLILYFKQISEGYEDEKRFEIMQNIGMTKEEIKQTIKSQMRIIFIFPLILSAIHLAFASKMMLLILTGLGFYGPMSFILSIGFTFIIISVIYIISYGQTAKVYYQIVVK